MLNLSQQEFVRKIEQLNQVNLNDQVDLLFVLVQLSHFNLFQFSIFSKFQELIAAWENEQKVKALKIAIQVRYLHVLLTVLFNMSDFFVLDIQT